MLSMKNLSFIIAFLGAFLFVTQSQGQSYDVQESASIQATEKTETFKVYGNCVMCQRRIEGSLKDVEGIATATWDVDTKMMTVKFAEESISLDDIQKRIADVGHDTEKYRADDTTYAKLPGCCKYERSEK